MSVVLTSEGRGTDMYRPPTVRQALSVVFSSGLPNRHPSRHNHTHFTNEKTEARRRKK